MSKRYCIGLDLGGTSLKSGLVGETGEIFHFSKRPSGGALAAQAPLAAIAEAVDELRVLAGGIPAGIGLGAPGAIDPRSGSLVGTTPHMPHWSDFPLREAVENLLGVPVAVDNDANLAALAEHHWGAARGARSSITVTVGTGVGCGIVVGGEVVRGAHGGAGEIGHLPIGRGGLACRCGVEACLEPDMSGGGLARRAAASGLESAGAEDVFAAAAAGDRAAGALVEDLCDRLGLAIAIAVDLIDPGVVVLGGGVSEAGEALMSGVGRALGRYALASHRRGLRLVPAAMGERAGVAGAGLLAWRAATRAVADGAPLVGRLGSV